MDEGSARPKAATYTQDNTNTEYKHIQTSIPWMGFETTIPGCERAKTVHVLDRTAAETFFFSILDVKIRIFTFTLPALWKWLKKMEPNL
jgi:hypothetical protein